MAQFHACSLSLLEERLASHEANWAQEPDVNNIGQYYCSKCKLELNIWYSKNSDGESCNGWYWEISDGSGQVVNSAGNKRAPRYEPDVEALDEIKKEALLRFDSLPCSRSN